MANKKRKKRITKVTFTKSAIKGILIVALLDIQFPFILAFLGREQIAEDLGKLIVAEIIGVFLTYCLKSFFETRESELIRLKEKAMDTPMEVIPDTPDGSDLVIDTEAIDE